MDNIDIDLSKTTRISCECGCVLFTEFKTLRKASMFITGADKDMIIPVIVPVCKECGKIFKGILPNYIYDDLVNEENV